MSTYEQRYDQVELRADAATQTFHVIPAVELPDVGRLGYSTGQSATEGEAAKRKRFAAVSWDLGFPRWVTALLSTTLLFGVVGVAAGQLGWTADVLSSAATLGTLTVGTLGFATAVIFLGVVMIAHHVVGYVAGRRSRVNGAGEGTNEDVGLRLVSRAEARPMDSGACPFSGESQATSANRHASEVEPSEAEEFLELFHAENPGAGPVQLRIAQVRREIETTGTYWHTPDELAFGARVAWRNNSRCIGRLYWRSLQVRDLRSVGDARNVAAQCVSHLRQGTNGGKIRPLISVFPPDTPSRSAPRIWNEQLIRYAGYELPGGRTLGDPRYCDFAKAVMRRGWRLPEKQTAFDVLPLVVETAEEGPRMFAIPDEAVLEVDLEHPELEWFAELGLRWHALPVISNNRLDIGGVSYPAAPFNGWYMGTEIGARNLADTERYDMVPLVAERMGLDTSGEATLWRDRALVEINRAVLHSFQARSVTIADHHTESRRFLTHLQREERAGRSCPADWSWIVPPMSGAQTPVFHRYYDSADMVPNFFLDDDAVQRALQGGPPRFG